MEEEYNPRTRSFRRRIMTTQPKGETAEHIAEHPTKHPTMVPADKNASSKQGTAGSSVVSGQPISPNVHGNLDQKMNENEKGQIPGVAEALSTGTQERDFQKVADKDKSVVEHPVQADGGGGIKHESGTKPHTGTMKSSDLDKGGKK
jgi:hypothetical protein